jgi:hypothetical protein
MKQLDKLAIYVALGILLTIYGLWADNPSYVVGGCFFFMLMELRLTERDIIKAIQEKKND